MHNRVLQSLRPRLTTKHGDMSLSQITFQLHLLQEMIFFSHPVLPTSFVPRGMFAHHLFAARGGGRVARS